VQALRERGLKVVDLSADFRLDRERYERWYQPHEAPELLPEAVYGLPEIGHRDEIRAADLVAAPGCNSTAALLGLWPLREHLRDAVVDIKTGVSGAGREATEETHYVSASDNVNAYKIEGHRHSAELEQELPGVAFTFVPHLIPVDQGLMATNYAITKSELSKDDVLSLLHDAYANEPFIDVVGDPPHTSHVRGTNRARVYGTVTGNRVLTVAVIDNLWKGAAGQAVQDLNLMLGLPETEGLE
jgi:N-acetyl-gamma-glutamyl-phosphate reductase